MSQLNNILYFSEDDLTRLGINTAEVIDSIEALIFGGENGTVWAAPKAVLLPPDGRYMMAALAAADDPPLLAVKTVVLNPRNSEKGLAQINGLVTMLDSDTGLPVAIMDGNWITAVRTAGLSAVAAKYLARPESSVAAFIGTGVQAKSHLQAYHDIYPLEEIRIFGRGQANINSLVEMADGMNLSAVVCASAKEAIKGADLIATSISFSPDFVPFLDADWTKPGSFSAVADLGVPWIKDTFERFDTIIIDDLEQEAVLPEKLVRGEWVCGDLTGLVLGKCKGRINGDERNAFIFRGHALGDLALSALAFKRAKETLSD
ncbi:MAG: ornithine cyclodeaminase family protein [Hyphomicrobiales bacterium]|nr:ornithine cyclodeaminase family protein [Hyphomicrobiales bacterium]